MMVPPIFNAPVAPCVKVEEPESAVEAVIVPLFVSAAFTASDVAHVSVPLFV